jgi:hypothetical protein
MESVNSRTLRFRRKSANRLALAATLEHSTSAARPQGRVCGFFSGIAGRRYADLANLESWSERVGRAGVDQELRLVKYTWLDKRFEADGHVGQTHNRSRLARGAL